jgi:GNAT superfamily N-acetyltransferase
VVPKNARGQGIGSQFMKDLTEYADANGKTIILTPSKDFGATSVNRLKDFYKDFGFSKNKDFRYSESMMREPKESAPKPYNKSSKTVASEGDFQLIDVNDDYGSAEGYTVDTSAEQLKNWVEEWVRNGQEEIIVFGVRENFKRLAVLNTIQVEEEHQGQGYGSGILEEFIGLAFDEGAEIILLVATQDATSSKVDLRKWYESYGFKLITETVGGPLMMLKKEEF